MAPKISRPGAAISGDSIVFKTCSGWTYLVREAAAFLLNPVPRATAPLAGHDISLLDHRSCSRAR
jgi:hypothetical protein